MIDPQPGPQVEKRKIVVSEPQYELFRQEQGDAWCEENLLLNKPVVTTALEAPPPVPPGRTAIQFTGKGKMYERTAPPEALLCPKCGQAVQYLLGDGEAQACEACYSPIKVETVDGGPVSQQEEPKPDPVSTIPDPAQTPVNPLIKDSAGNVVGGDKVEEDPEITSFRDQLKGQAQKETGGEQ